MKEPRLVTTITEVTPTMCTTWLEDNPENRPLNQRHINQLARAMLQGDWDLNGESLKFDTENHILDGQHRMWACIESGVTFKTMIVKNLPRTTFDTIDTGRMRSAADVLTMNGEQNTTLLAGILKHIGRYYTGQMLTTYKITNKELECLLEKHPQTRDITTTLSRPGYRVRWCAPSILGTTWYLASSVNKKAADTFFTGLIFGVNLEKESPILTLRNKFIDVYGHKGQTLSASEKLEMVILTWNAFRKDLPLKHFKLQRLTKDSKKFPKLT